MTFLALAAATLSLSTATAAYAYDNQYAALAIDHNAGDAYGWAVNHYTQGQADAAALSECGRGQAQRAHAHHEQRPDERRARASGQVANGFHSVESPRRVGV
jgi:hypothetical protein